MSISKVLVATAAVAFASMVSVASAADITYESAPVPIEVAAYDWTGLYVGGQLGYGWGKTDYEHQNVNNFGGPGGTYFNDTDNFLYGAQIGYNYQVSNWVFGVEAAVTNGTDGNYDFSQYNNDTTTDVKYVATVTGRVGYAIDTWLVYGKAGYAGGDVKAGQVYSGQSPSLVWSDSQWANGWTVGAGVEKAVTKNVTVGIEYAHVDLGSVDFSAPDSSGKLTNISGDTTSDSVMFRLNYKF